MARFITSSFIIQAIAFLCISDLTSLISAKICGTTLIKYELDEFNKLEGCTVIEGSLVIGLLKFGARPQDYKNITYPQLREVTDFVLFYDVRELTDMSNLFPNLAVIRGRRLFTSYALAFSNMPKLKAVEFRNLIAIQRGHVFIGTNPELCYLKKVNWDRLTIGIGENHIFPGVNSTCDFAQCLGCDYCWSNKFCQKFENANLVNLMSPTTHCHPQCLGGCYNSSNTGCYVCKGITENGACVEQCSSNTYYSENFQRCFTKEECYQRKLYTHKNTCIKRCPSGFNHSRKVGECVPCQETCIKECQPDEYKNQFDILSLGDVEEIQTCEYAKASIFISFKNKVDEKELVNLFANLRRVDGFVKIFYSNYLTSLNFFENLDTIEGRPLENNTYGLVIYNNNNLEDLWTPKNGKKFEIVDGGIYSYGNRKLCNKKLDDFGRMAIHNKERDLMQINDKDVLCDPVRMYVYEEKTTATTAKLSWLKDATADEVEIIYRDSQYNKGEDSELDDDVCSRAHWQRELVLNSDLMEENATHYTYILTNLVPFTSYDYLIKTFRKNDYYAARSPIQILYTKPDLPTAPKLTTLQKSFRNITIQMDRRNTTREIVNYYILEAFEQIPDIESLDLRAYCEEPSQFYGESFLEDFDECCEREKEQREDEEFKINMETKYACGLIQNKNCHQMVKSGYRTHVTVIDYRLTNFTVKNLKHFTTYTFFIYACNQVGCGAYYMYTDRTSAVKENDIISSAYACRDSANYGYLVKFSEPPSPNGAILNYFIQFRNTKVDVPAVDMGYTNCVSRKEFADNGYKVFLKFDGHELYNQFAIRVVTTGGNALSEWFDIDTKICLRKPKVNVVKIVLIIVGALGLLIIGYICIRKRLWVTQRIQGWRTGRRNRLDTLRGAFGLEDRQELVPSLDTVEFRRSRESVF